MNFFILRLIIVFNNIWDVGSIMCQYHNKIFIFRPGSAAVTDNLRGGIWYPISGYEMLLWCNSLPLKLSITEDGQADEKKCNDINLTVELAHLNTMNFHYIDEKKIMS